MRIDLCDDVRCCVAVLVSEGSMQNARAPLLKVKTKPDPACTRRNVKYHTISYRIYHMGKTTGVHDRDPRKE